MISWVSLKLGNPSPLQFPNGIAAVARFEEINRALEHRHRQAALISIASNGVLELADNVDSSPNYDEPWILVVSGNVQDRLLLFGGEVAYVIASDGRIVSTIPTFRERRNAEFWRTEVLKLDDDTVLIVYEVGVLVIQSTLEVRWHVQKALIDFFDRRDGAKLVFLRDHETPFSIDLSDGSGVPQIVAG